MIIQVVVEGIGSFSREARERSTIAGFSQDVGYPLSELVWSRRHDVLLNDLPASLMTFLSPGDCITIRSKVTRSCEDEAIEARLRELGFI